MSGRFLKKNRDFYIILPIMITEAHTLQYYGYISAATIGIS